MDTRTRGELKSEELEKREAPLTMTTIESVLDMRSMLDMPIDAQPSTSDPELPSTPCYSPRSGTREPIVYQELSL